jgi:hypothetical protein
MSVTAVALLGLMMASPRATSPTGTTPVATAPALPENAPARAALAQTDRIRLAEAFRLAETLGNRVWPGWDQAPFAVLLVTPEHEFLVRHPSPSADFVPIGDDPVLKEKVCFRARQHPTSLLATFPAVGGVSTIVIGQAENTDSKTSTRWVITLLHEHFHQLQDSRPGNYDAVAALGLARGDQTGMWMLNYPFPYDDPGVKERFSALCRTLSGALSVRGQPEFAAKLEAYAAVRRAFLASLQPDDARYLAFQIWKEGIARYTELRIAELAGAEYTPSRAFRDLADYRSFGDVARGIRRGIEKDLLEMRLDEVKRSAVYSLGAADGLVLDAASPAWRERYLEKRFSLDSFFARPPRG